MKTSGRPDYYLMGHMITRWFHISQNNSYTLSLLRRLLQIDKKVVISLHMKFISPSLLVTLIDVLAKKDMDRGRQSDLNFSLDFTYLSKSKIS